MAKVSLLAKLGLNTKDFQKNMAKAQRSVQGFGRKFGNIMGGLGMKLGALGAVLATKQMANLAVVAEETASKFGAVFKNSLEKMTAEMNKLKQTIPATTQEMQDALSTFGAMAKAFGMNEQEAGDFSIELVKIAGDLASFHNLPMEQAFSKLRSGLTGSAEPLMQLGIIVKQTEVKLEAMRLGLIEEGEEMNALGRAIATHSIIVQQMGDAHGDAGITASSTANQLKFLRAEILDNATAIGNQLTPMLGDMVRLLGDVVPVALKARDAIGEFIGRQLFMGGKSDLEFEAIQDLKKDPNATDFEKQFGFSKERIAQRVKELKKEKKLIEERKEQERFLRKMAKLAEQERIEQAQREMDLAFTAEEKLAVAQKQIKVETDPRRLKSLQHSIDFNTKLIKVLKERNAEFAQGTGDQNEENRKRDEEARKVLLDQELKLLKAQTTGNDELIKKEKEKLEFMKKTLDIMQRHNMSIEDAIQLQSDLDQAENRAKTSKKAQREMGIDKLSTHELGSIATNIMKKRKGVDGRLQVEDIGGGKQQFRQFINGSHTRDLSVDQVRQMVASEAVKEDTNDELQALYDIRDAIKQKTVSE